MPYQLVESEKGIKSLTYINADKKIRLHSAFNPIKEAERNTENFIAKKKSPYIIVIGLGLGYHLDALNKKFSDYQLIVIEKDPEVISITAKVFPEYLKNNIIIHDLNSLSNLMDTIDIRSFKGFSIFTHRPSYLLDSGFYDNFLIEINNYISSKISDLLTRFEFEEKWVKNILKNLPALFNSTQVINLFNKFKGIPGIIVSAGPSLRKNIQHLKKIKNKAVITCVDTALKVMLKSGITPHFVMVLDAQKHSQIHFMGIKNYQAVLLADLVSYPNVLKYYKGQKIISTTSKYYNDLNGNFKRETTPLIDWLEKYIPPIGDIQSGGSVATSLFDFLLNLGCSKIILVGQDLAYTGREIHSSGTYHNDNWLPTINRFINLETINQKVIRKRKINYVTAYNIKEKVLTDFVLNIYRKWFEDSAQKVKIPIINATEGGADIEFTKKIKLKELSSSLSTPEQSIEQIIKNALNQKYKIDKDKLLKGIKAVLNFTAKMNKVFTSSDVNIKEILNTIKNSEINSFFSTFIKKTETYILRHPELSEEEKNKLFIKEIKSALQRIFDLFKKSEESINNLSE